MTRILTYLSKFGNSGKARLPRAIQATSLYSEQDPIAFFTYQSSEVCYAQASDSPETPDMYYSQISYTAIGRHKDNCRVWIEGKRLGACGFDQGQAYVVILDVAKRTLILRTTKDGDKVVSGRKADSAGNVHPIIDLCNANITEHLRTHMGNPTRVRVAFKYGEITVSIREIERNARRREQRPHNCAYRRSLAALGVRCPRATAQSNSHPRSARIVLFCAVVSIAEA